MNLGCHMYRKIDKDQIVLEDFALPFGGKLDGKNRWVKLSKITPWDKIEEYYVAGMNEDIGRGAISARIAYGAISIRQSEGLSDENTVRFIQENPYAQYYLGLHEFNPDPLFDSSMMVYFRKRFPVEFIVKVNEYICTGKWPEEMRQVDKNDTDANNGSNGSNEDSHPDQTEKDECVQAEEPSTESPEEAPPVPEAVAPKQVKQNSVKNKGKLVMDATVAPADIKYPTDIDLLNQCREHLEKAIDLAWPYVTHDMHKLPYGRKKARKEYLDVSKSKKWTREKLRKAVSQQLKYIELATARLERVQQQINEKDWQKLIPNWLKDRLAVIPLVYEQQKEMFDSGNNRCENRIVSLQQSHVHPIVRGKRPNPTEFGQKLHLSVVDGYVFLEQTCWNNFNESRDLIATVENYRRRTGYYPKAVLADKIYQTRANRAFCKENGIRLSGPPLGRQTEENSKSNKRQMYKDSCERNVVEGKIGTAKRRYGLDLIMSKLDETSKTDAALSIMMMNAWKRVKQELLRIFYCYWYFGVIPASELNF